MDIIDNDVYLNQLQETLEDTLDYGKLKKLANVTGGIVNKASLFETENGSRRIFVKYSSRDNALDMFESEFYSLNDIKNTEAIRVPNPIKVLKHPEKGAMFVLDWIEDLKPVQKLWSNLGEQIANLHLNNPQKLLKEKKQENVVGKYENSNAIYKFGYHHSTYMGSRFKIPANTWRDDWETNFIRDWLKPQFDEAERKFGNRELMEKWNPLERKLPRLFEGLKFLPSLIHGDLCTINIGEADNEIVLYDPTCSYAPLETDHTIINMEKNFGKEFHDIYSDKVDHIVTKDRKNLRMDLYKIFALLLVGIDVNEESMIQEAIETIDTVTFSI